MNMLTLATEPLLAVDNIQGNILRGFDTEWQMILGLKCQSATALKTWLAGIGKSISSLKFVHEYRIARSNNALHGDKPVLINAAVSGDALRLMGFDTTPIGEGFLNVPMGSLRVTLGDSKEDVENFKIGKDRQTTPEVILLLGCEQKDTLSTKTDEIIKEAVSAGLSIIYNELGHKLPGEIEHFGFRDGISQVGIRGLLKKNPLEPLTLRQLDDKDPLVDSFAAPGKPLVWPGQFVFGYPLQKEKDLTPGDIAGTVDWLRDGSLLVFRRLSQNVAAFQDFLNETAPGLGMTPEQLSAKIVGRWKDGTPVMLQPDAPSPDIAKDELQVNHFNYDGIQSMNVRDQNGQLITIPGVQSDIKGSRCPHFAHIRKVNPRDLQTDQGSGARTLMFQMIRRGIPFGPLYSPGEKGAVDRGLLFISYQTSITNQFKILNTQWMNNPDAPEFGSVNHDLLVGQATLSKDRTGTLSDNSTITTQKKWITPTGGCFMFCPSISFLKSL